MLRALQPADVYSPDFVHPPPGSPLTELEDELAAMVATPPEQVRAEVRDTYRDRPLPPALEPFIDLRPPPSRRWPRSCASTGTGAWRRIGPGCARCSRATCSTARAAWPTAARSSCSPTSTPTVSWQDGVLRIVKRVEATVELDERGLLFVPSVFVWPAVLLITAAPWQPTLIYPARGVGSLWEPDRVRPPAALAALLGRSRAAVLLALEQPRSTTDLARALGITAGGASQQLAVLRDAGLVHGHRVGRVVLYLRTPAGDDLLAAAEGGASRSIALTC